MRYVARKRRRWPRLGVSGGVAILVFLVGLGGAFMLDRLSPDAGGAALAEHAREAGQDPVAFAMEAARSNRILVLGDVPTLPGPKRLAAELIEALAQGPGLDAVVLEVPAGAQPAIDAYLESSRENVAPLLTGGAVPDGGASQQPYLRIYRAVWRVNEERSPSRRIRILAADVPGWPPGSDASPSEAARLFGLRDHYMAQRIQSQLLDRHPRSRVLVFVGGLHALTGLQPRLVVRGSAAITPVPLAARLRNEHPTEVFAILTDGAPAASTFSDVVAYTATGAYESFRRHFPGQSFALRLGPPFDTVRDPILGTSTPGVELHIVPRDATLADAADGYVYLGGGGA